jgi:hypothetical protein
VGIGSRGVCVLILAAFGGDLSSSEESQSLRDLVCAFRPCLPQMRANHTSINFITMHYTAPLHVMRIRLQIIASQTFKRTVSVNARRHPPTSWVIFEAVSPGILPPSPAHSASSTISQTPKLPCCSMRTVLRSQPRSRHHSAARHLCRAWR